MSKNSEDIVETLHRKFKTLDRIRNKQESLFKKCCLNKRDIEEVYSAVFLNAVVSFEALIEQLFIGLLAGQIEHSKYNVKAKICVRNSVVARELVCLTKNYFSWLPFENTQNIAPVFFSGGRPFSFLDSEDRKKIKKCLCLRNAIAHQSEHALNRFKKEVINGVTLMPRERNPKSFLRSQFSSSPVTVRYQVLIGDLLVIARKLC